MWVLVPLLDVEFGLLRQGFHGFSQLGQERGELCSGGGVGIIRLELLLETGSFG